MERFLERMQSGDDTDVTRRSLISRLRNADDEESWKEFFATYWKLIYSVAIKSGLSDQEAEDVVQETVLSVAKKMPGFVYDRSKCTFKGWLMHVTRLRIMDQLRRRLPVQESGRRRAENDSRRTPTVERFPDEGLNLESVWNDEWKKNLIDAAMHRIRGRVNPNHYQIFYLNAVKNYTGPQVAKMLGVSLAQVYVVRHRIAKLIKKEVELLEAEGQ